MIDRNPWNVARWAVALGALSALVGCSDDPAVVRTAVSGDGGADVVEATVAPRDVATPDVAKPDAAVDDVVDAPSLDAPVDDVTPDATTPDVVAPDEVTPDVATPDVAPPDDVALDVAAPDVSTGGCASSADCAPWPGTPVCDPVTHACVQCVPSDDTCPVGSYCTGVDRCEPGCRTSRDCTAGRCDEATHACVGCVSDDDCGTGTVCQASRCVPGCTPTHGCGAGATCCDGACARVDSDGLNCGACGNACSEGYTCCTGRCIDLQRDADHCGACGSRCSATHGGAVCAAATCGVARCDTGFADCDGTPANGCEVPLATTTEHCGRCGNACPSAPGATPTCAASACRFACLAGRGDCDTSRANGCETDIRATVAHCGACGAACPTRPHSAPSCVSGACGVVCEGTFGNCDGNPVNGCEVDLATSPASCGACGRACSYPHATPACAAGACALGACEAGWANCDGDPANGCETSVDSDRANCGACGRVCAGGASCMDGACSTVCRAPGVVCGSFCVNTSVDINNCGACGRGCPASAANGYIGCNDGACEIACNRGTGDCNVDLRDGCETALTTNLAHCGACGHACAFDHAAASCRAGACLLGACESGWADCDGNPANGCEVNLSLDATNCGACGQSCALAHAGAACTAGRCAVARCDTGFADCDGNPVNGCEVNLQSSPTSCGACGRACVAGEACARGACVMACAAGTTFCDGACVDNDTDASHCGACGVRCLSGQVCTAGRCVPPRPANDTPMGAAPINLATPSSELVATTVGATPDVRVPCLSSGVNAGSDVFYRFTLAQREIVYADTFAGGYDSTLFLLDGSGAPMTSQIAGDQVCNDDAAGLCDGVGTTSLVFSVLPPGDYFLVLGGYGSATGSTRIHFEHLAAGAGAIAWLPAGMSTHTGMTSGGGSVTGTCAGTGPEDTLWWRTCPAVGAGALSADTCGTASFDTVLHVAHGDGTASACDDDGCGFQSMLSATVPMTARLHALYVDAFSGGGTYTVRVTRP